MVKRIFKWISLTAVRAVIIAVALSAFMILNMYENQMAAGLRSEAGLVLHSLALADDETAYFDGFSSENRVTLISPEGEVLYDSGADADSMSNHADRPEIIQALQTGRGESRRYSDTLAEITFYYAARTDSGNILRISNTRSSIFGLLLQLAPAMIGIVLLTLVVSLIVARVLSRRIVAPLNALDLDHPLNNSVYDELSPLLTRMDRQRRQIETQMQDLQRTQNELEIITANMREGLIILDTHSAILSINASAARIFGVEADTRVGSSMLTVNRSAAVREAIACAINGSGADAMLEKDGCYYQLIASPVSRDGAAAGALLLIMDVTEKYSAEMSRREFTANVSHELRTPLTSILGYAEIMRDGLVSADNYSNFAARIYSEASRLVALINDILDLSQLDERKGLGEKEPVDLMSLSLETSRRLESRAAGKNIKLSVDGVTAVVNGHRLLLGEMLYNIVDNAIKYTPDGGKVDVLVEKQGDTVLCSVSDTGIGIAPEHHERIFERFYRVDKSHSRATGGTGLGLSIVKHGAAIHGAQIILDSAPGHGTTIGLKFHI